MSDHPRTDVTARGATVEGPCHDAATVYSTHLVRCGVCGRWLHVDEDELLASLEQPLSCWTCAGGG